MGLLPKRMRNELNSSIKILTSGWIFRSHMASLLSKGVGLYTGSFVQCKDIKDKWTKLVVTFIFVLPVYQSVKRDMSDPNWMSPFSIFSSPFLETLFSKLAFWAKSTILFVHNKLLSEFILAKLITWSCWCICLIVGGIFLGLGFA